MTIDLFNEKDTCFYFTKSSPFNVAVSRRWGCYSAVLARLTNALTATASGHLGPKNSSGTPQGDAVTLRVETKLGGLVRRFVKQKWQMSPPSSDSEDVSHAALHQVAGYDMTRPPRKPSGAAAEKGDFCRLHVGRAALPNKGEAGTCVLTDVLEKDHPLLQPETLLDPDRPSRAELRKLPAVAHCEAGHWPKICERMFQSTMIEYAEAGTDIVQNSVFGILKGDAHDAPHRFINAARAANLCWRRDCGKVMLPHPDLLTRLRLAPGTRIRGASCDVDQCYNRMRVPVWMRAYLGLPSVWSSDVGVKGSGRWLIPFMTVLPMGIAPAVRICQEVVETVVKRSSPCRLFLAPGDQVIGHDRLPIDLVYLDDVVTIGPDESVVNKRNDAVATELAAAGLPTAPRKKRRADNKSDFCDALGLSLWAKGVITPSVARLEKLKVLTDTILASEAASPRQMAAAVGTAVSCCLLRRPLLSILYAVFRFITSGEYDQSRRVPVACLRELSTLLDLAPAMEHSLQPAHSGRVYFTDASTYGGGVVYASNIAAEERTVLDETRVQQLWQPLKPMGRDIGAGDLGDSMNEVSHSKDAATGKWTVSREFREFFTRRPFTVAMSTQWRCGAHINALELEALLLALRHCGSVLSSSGSEVYFGLDSAVALGVLKKGRSSSYALNTVARKICAATITSNLWPVYFWTPTDLQPADEPSRRFNYLAKHDVSPVGGVVGARC